jgi:hypothetical protein
MKQLFLITLLLVTSEPVFAEWTLVGGNEEIKVFALSLVALSPPWAWLSLLG